MEIFQTIWTALITENALLASIFAYCFTFIEATVTALIFILVLNIKTSKKNIVLYIIALTIISILNGLCVPNPYNTFLNVLICPILVIIIFKTKISRAILAEIIPYVVFVLSGAIVLNTYILLFNVSTEILVNVPIYRVCSSLSIYLLAYIIYRILKYFKVNISFLDSIKSKANYTLLINFIIGILAVGVQSYVAFIYSDKLPLGVIILNISTLLFYFVISFYSLIRTNKLEVTQRDLEQSKQYINTLTILHDSIRCFKHDFSNIVATIGRLRSNR